MLHRVLIGYFRGVLPEKDRRMTNPPPPLHVWINTSREWAGEQWAPVWELRKKKKKKKKGAAHGAETPHGVPSVCEGTDTDEPVSKRRLLSPSFSPHVSPAGAMGSHQFQPPDAWEEKKPPHKNRRDMEGLVDLKPPKWPSGRRQ